MLLEPLLLCFAQYSNTAHTSSAVRYSYPKQPIRDDWSGSLDDKSFISAVVFADILLLPQETRSHS